MTFDMSDLDFAAISRFWERGPRSPHLRAVNEAVRAGYARDIFVHHINVKPDTVVDLLDPAARARMRDVRDEIEATLYFSEKVISRHLVAFHCRLEGRISTAGLPVSTLCLTVESCLIKRVRLTSTSFILSLCPNEANVSRLI